VARVAVLKDGAIDGSLSCGFGSRNADLRNGCRSIATGLRLCRASSGGWRQVALRTGPALPWLAAISLQDLVVELVHSRDHIGFPVPVEVMAGLGQHDDFSTNGLASELCDHPLH